VHHGEVVRRLALVDEEEGRRTGLGRDVLGREREVVHDDLDRAGGLAARAAAAGGRSQHEQSRRHQRGAYGSHPMTHTVTGFAEAALAATADLETPVAVADQSRLEANLAAM